MPHFSALKHIAIILVICLVVLFERSHEPFVLSTPDATLSSIQSDSQLDSWLNLQNTPNKRDTARNLEKKTTHENENRMAIREIIVCTVWHWAVQSYATLLLIISLVARK